MFVCDVPRSAPDFLSLIGTERRLFGEFALSDAKALSIFEFCPEFYSAIYANDGSIVAYSSAFPLKTEYASDLISGAMAESDLEPEMLISTEGPIGNSKVYIGSVVVADHFDPITRAILLSSLLSWRMIQMTHLALSRLSVFMVTVSEQGDQMVRFVRAKKLNDGTNRKDGKSVYGRTITPGFVARASSSLERCANGRLVQMRYERRQKAPAGARA
jgi:hypothetical protein